MSRLVRTLDRTAAGTALILVLTLTTAAACATHVTQHQGVQVAISVHAALAAIDDAELLVAGAGLITPAEHAAVSPVILRALRAGQALDASVRVWPADGAVTRANLSAITSALGDLATAVSAFASPSAQTRVQSAIVAAQSALLLVSVTLLGGS